MTSAEHRYRVAVLVRNQKTHNDNVLTVNVRAADWRSARAQAVDYFSRPGQSPIYTVTVDQITDRGYVHCFSHAFGADKT